MVLRVQVITVTTVGFGDIAPQSVGSRIFSIIFVPIGVVFFANALSVISGIPLQQRKARLEDYVGYRPPHLSAFPFKTGATAYLIMREGRS